MSRVYNFSAGPAALPEAVLARAADEMLDWHGSGMSVMEMSHRGRHFQDIADHAQSRLRELLRVPHHYRILFMQGGALAENAIVPLNLARGRTSADYIETGIWSQKSIKEASRYLDVHVAASSAADEFSLIPPSHEWKLRREAAYVHICSNETIGGLEYHWVPELPDGAVLVSDMSSSILSRPVEIERYGVIYAGAQKNIGPAGLTIVIIREDLLGATDSRCPSAFDYTQVAAANSMYNTPPTYAIYIAGLVLDWLSKHASGRHTALEMIEQQNRDKADLLYRTLDASEFYRTRVRPADRSRMNVPFFLPDERLNSMFLDAATERHLVQLKGHKSLGGIRASLYNAMPLAGVEALVALLKDFEAQHG